MISTVPADFNVTIPSCDTSAIFSSLDVYVIVPLLFALHCNKNGASPNVLLIALGTISTPCAFVIFAGISARFSFNV